MICSFLICGMLVMQWYLINPNRNPNPTFVLDPFQLASLHFVKDTLTMKLINRQNLIGQTLRHLIEGCAGQS